MNTRSTKTIREHVIALHRHAGFSPSESVRLWDDVYSKEYYSIKPGVKHTWVIGEYQFEFTKQATDPIELIAQANAEAVNLESQSRALSWVKLIAVLVIVIALIYLTTTLFEDGSFITLGFIKGCLPWGICNL